jgi:hypothetical protein
LPSQRICQLFPLPSGSQGSSSRTSCFLIPFRIRTILFEMQFSFQDIARSHTSILLHQLYRHVEFRRQWREECRMAELLKDIYFCGSGLNVRQNLSLPELPAELLFHIAKFLPASFAEVLTLSPHLIHKKMGYGYLDRIKRPLSIGKSHNQTSGRRNRNYFRGLENSWKGKNNPLSNAWASYF